MRSSKILSQHPVIDEKRVKHCFRSQASLVVIFDTLVPRDASNGPQSVSVQLPGAFGNCIGDREYLIGILVQQQM